MIYLKKNNNNNWVKKVLKKINYLYVAEDWHGEGELRDRRKR